MPPPEKVGKGGSMVSAVVHGLIIFAIVWSPGVGEMLVDAARGGPGELGGGGGGGGGEQVTYVAMPPFQVTRSEQAPPEVEVEPEPEPLFQPQIINSPSVVQPDITRRQIARRALDGEGEGPARGPGSGPGSGGGIGTGTGTGTGSNDGPGTGGGGGSIIPPSPRHTFLPPSGIPGSLKGRSFVVHFWVTAEGDVTRLTITPRVEDSGYRTRLRETLMRFRFRPQISAEGTPMAGETDITITL